MIRYIFLLLSILGLSELQAQCNGRYETEIFQNTTVQTVTYSPVTNLNMDIYTGDGDTENSRPLVILAHGGAFISGTKTNPLMVSLAEKLAKRGYVVASISYRLMSIANITQPSQFIDGVVKSMSDGRAAIRYFYKSVVDNANPYGIDTNQIYFGGNSAGGVIGLHAAFLDQSDNPTGDFLTALNNNGGIEGNSGNAGYSSKLAGVISLAGGIADVNFITANETNTLLISAHGDLDNIVPFNCGQPLNNAQLPQLCGGGALEAHSATLNYNKHFHSTFTGKEHCPWNSDLTDENSVTSFVLQNLYENLPCHQPVGTTDIESDLNIAVYPNPTQSVVYIESENTISQIHVFSSTGQKMFTTTSSIVNLKNLESGMYFLKVQTEDYTLTKSVIKQ